MSDNGHVYRDEGKLLDNPADKESRYVNPVQKTAILLMSIGENRAADILRHLGPSEVQDISIAMASLESVSVDDVSMIADQFIRDLVDQTGVGLDKDDYLRNTLVEALGEDRASSLIDRIVMGINTQGLDTLRAMETKAIAELIRHEHPQIQAIVVAYLDPDQGGSVLRFLPETVRKDVIVRIANLETIQPQAIQELNDILERQFSTQSSSTTTSMGGEKVAANIMNFLGSAIEREVLDGIKGDDENLAQRIEDLMFVFEDLVGVDDRAVQTILKEISADTLVLALKGSDEKIKDKIFGNMSSRAADLLKDDLEAKGPVRLSDVDTAQKEILATARRLSEAGDIILDNSGESMV